jgi:hypothetical protein
MNKQFTPHICVDCGEVFVAMFDVDKCQKCAAENTQQKDKTDGKSKKPAAGH